MLLAVSRVHETVPHFLVEGVKRRLNGTLRDKKIAVLGLTFKRDTDDPRDSLSFKLIRLLERELCQVVRHDPFLPDQSDPLDEALSGAEGVIVATNHSAYEDVLARLAPQTLLCDPWNVTGAGQVFAFTDELVLAKR